MRAALTVARFVLIEARRSGLTFLLLAAIAAGIGLAGFVSRLALTESAHLQTGVLAALFRFTAVFLTAAFVITSMVRESGDKGTELLLSLPISRTTYYLGKLAGFGASGALLAFAFSVVLLAWSAPYAVMVWFTSLALETLLVASVSLFFVVSLGQVVPALAGTAGIYLLGRAIAAIQSISVSPLVEEQDALQQVAARTVDAVALLLPPLEKATRTEWLLYAPPAAGELSLLLGALVLYAALIAAAGLVDFHRRNL